MRLRSLLRSPFRARRAPTASRVPACVEPLEGRRLLSTTYVWVSPSEINTEGAQVPAGFTINAYNQSFGGKVGVGYSVGGSVDGPGGEEVDHDLVGDSADVYGNPYTARASVPLNINRDNLVEGDETVTLSITILSGDAVIAYPPHLNPTPAQAPGTATASIIDSPPRVSVISEDNYADEEDATNKIEFKFERSGGDRNQALEARYNIITADDILNDGDDANDGDASRLAESGVDYTGLSTRVKFDPGEMVKTVIVTAKDDAIAETAEEGLYVDEFLEIELFPTRQFIPSESDKRVEAFIDDGTTYRYEQAWSRIFRPPYELPVQIGQSGDTTVYKSKGWRGIRDKFAVSPDFGEEARLAFNWSTSDSRSFDKSVSGGLDFSGLGVPFTLTGSVGTTNTDSTTTGQSFEHVEGGPDTPNSRYFLTAATQTFDLVYVEDAQDNGGQSGANVKYVEAGHLAVVSLYEVWVLHRHWADPDNAAFQEHQPSKPDSYKHAAIKFRPDGVADPAMTTFGTVPVTGWNGTWETLDDDSNNGITDYTM